jgi:chromosome segregation ATPase
VIRDKFAAENKSRNVLEKVTTLEKEKEDLRRRLNDEKEDAKNARAGAQAACKRVADLELELKNMHGHRERIESSTCARVDRTHTLFVDAYRDLGTQTAPSTNWGGGGEPRPEVVAK